MFHLDQSVARHVDRGLRRTTLDEHLPEDRRLLRHRSRSFWEQRASRVGPETLALVQAVFDQDQVLSHLRQLQAVVKHLEQFPMRRAEAASRMVREGGDLSYRALKTTLSQGLDLREALSTGTRSAPPTSLEELPCCPTCGTSSTPVASESPRRLALRPTGS